MRAEVISIGDELTSGQRLDTNSQWISTQLGLLGVEVLFHSTVGDDLQASIEVFQHAIDRADIVIATGGLGPTADDLTREALAAAAGVTLVRDDAILESIAERFARYGRSMPASNERQAYFPVGSQIVPNPHGTAPGIALRVARSGGKSDCHVFALPGVPAELFEMWEGTVQDAIADLRPERRVILHRRIKCFGAGESYVESLLPDLIRRGRIPKVGITVSGATITLRITAEGATSAECSAAIEPTVATIYQCLGTLVYGEEEDELEHSLLRLLAHRQQSLVTVEWGSGGQLAEWLTAAKPTSGQSCYLGGWIVQQELLSALLQISAAQLAEWGPTSKLLAEAMAVRARELAGSDYALAISDFPQSASTAEEISYFSVAVASSAGVQSRHFRYAGHPSILKPRSSKQAFDTLRQILLGQSPPSE